MPQFHRIASVCLLALSCAAPAWARLGVGPSAPIDPVKFPAVRNQDQAAAADNGSVTLELNNSPVAVNRSFTIGGLPPVTLSLPAGPYLRVQIGQVGTPANLFW